MSDTTATPESISTCRCATYWEHAQHTKEPTGRESIEATTND